MAIMQGDNGPVKQKAMEILVALGEIFNADKLIDVESAQISGVSYKTIGDAGLHWVESMLSEKVVIPSTLNPTGIDLRLWRQMGIAEEFAGKQMQIINAYSKLGVKTLCSYSLFIRIQSKV